MQAWVPIGRVRTAHCSFLTSISRRRKGIGDNPSASPPSSDEFIRKGPTLRREVLTATHAFRNQQQGVPGSARTDGTPGAALRSTKSFSPSQSLVVGRF
jgi:hypothetical protein